MPDSTSRRSPIHDELAARGAEWHLVGGIPFAIQLSDEPSEQAAGQSLAICDLSGLQKLGVKGCDAENWLASEDIEIPAAVFDSCSLSDGVMIVRFGTDEFFLEGGVGDTFVPSLAVRLNSCSGQVFRVERQEATFLLVGPRSLEVVAQTCGINFHEASPRQVVFTRVAGVSCGVFPEAISDIPVYRFWVDPSYALYLWKVLVEICESLDGSVVGVGQFFPELHS